MTYQEENQSKAKPFGVLLIAFSLIVSTIPFIYRSFDQGIDIIISPIATIEWAYISCAVLCAFGLIWKSEVARRGTIYIYAVLLCIVLFSIYLFVDPLFNSLVEFVSAHLVVPKKFSITLLISSMTAFTLWPLFVIFYLQYPNVKNQF